MKKIALYTALLTIAFTIHSYAMGLGEMTVNSYLNQPFNAEIELIDVGSVPVSGIKASLASVEDYERMGLERVYALNLLSFFVEKNAQGKVVVKVRSVERVSEPFMQLLVDLAWAEGQVYRSYTILLDPPNYRLNIAKKQLHNIVRKQYELAASTYPSSTGDENTEVNRVASSVEGQNRNVVSYGPTLANETIWQIAQRYKTENVLLQQMILAILGTNPEAFTEENLNGLKEGSHLQIPTNLTASKVPAALAKLEVLAQDKAWQSRKTTEHALLPPYIAGRVGIHEQKHESLTSVVPTIPQLSYVPLKESTNPSHLLPLSSSLLSVVEDMAPSTPNAKQPSSQGKVKATLDVATAAIDSVREANAMLVEQLHVLQRDNKRLQRQLTQSDQEMRQLRKKMNLLLIRNGLAGQVSSPSPVKENGGHIWSWMGLLVLVMGGAGLTYWWFWVRRRLGDTSPAPAIKPTLTPFIEEEGLTEASSTQAEEEEEEGAPDVAIIEQPMVKEPPAPETEPSVTAEDEQPIEPTTALPEPIVTEPTMLEAESKASITEDVPKEMDESDELDTEVPAPIEDIKPQEVEAIISEEPVIEERLLKEPQVEDDHVVEFEFSPRDEAPPALKEEVKEKKTKPPSKPKEETTQEEEKANPIKSKAALDTLLDLAKTYLSMEDNEAAKQSLQEVLDFGDDQQRKEAKRLLDDLNK